MTVDLHLHTHHSDGTWAPADLVRHALSLQMKYIAITDHDTTDGIEEGRAAGKGALEIIKAVELNTIYENSRGQKEDVHILGYFIDPDNDALKKAIALQKEAREKHVLDTIELLGKSGLSLSLALVRQFSGVGSIGRAHITQAIVQAGGARDLVEAYERYMKRDSEFYVPRESISPQQAISAINQAGGVASIAHPGKGEHIDKLILNLRDCGLKGIEAFHRSHSLQLIRHFIRFANRNAMFVSGGSDCHGPYQGYEATVGSISIAEELVHKMARYAL